jgi:hypothetical protein
MTTKHKLYVAFAIPSELVAFMESNNLEVFCTKQQLFLAEFPTFGLRPILLNL